MPSEKVVNTCLALHSDLIALITVFLKHLLAGGAVGLASTTRLPSDITLEFVASLQPADLAGGDVRAQRLAALSREWGMEVS